VAVLRPVGDHEEYAAGGDLVDEGVEHGLALRVDPLEILEDDQERLHLAFVAEQPRQGVERALAAPRAVERLPGDVEEREEHGELDEERLVGGEQLARDLLLDFPLVVAVVDLEIAPQELDHREVGRGPPVGEGAALEETEAVRLYGVGDLPDKARLAHARVADQGQDAAAAQSRPRRRRARLGQLHPAAHEERESALGGRLEPGAGPARADELESLDRRRESLDLHRSKRARLHEVPG
jgi:hypothetical protein